MLIPPEYITIRDYLELSPKDIARYFGGKNFVTEFAQKVEFPNSRSLEVSFTGVLEDTIIDGKARYNFNSGWVALPLNDGGIKFIDKVLYPKRTPKKIHFSGEHVFLEYDGYDLHVIVGDDTVRILKNYKIVDFASLERVFDIMYD